MILRFRIQGGPPCRCLAPLDCHCNFFPHHLPLFLGSLLLLLSSLFNGNHVAACCRFYRRFEIFQIRTLLLGLHQLLVGTLILRDIVQKYTRKQHIGQFWQQVGFAIGNWFRVSRFRVLSISRQESIPKAALGAEEMTQRLGSVL